MRIDLRVPTAHELEGKIVLLFFWAHWCPDCKADSPTVANFEAAIRKLL